VGCLRSRHRHHGTLSSHNQPALSEQHRVSPTSNRIGVDESVGADCFNDEANFIHVRRQHDAWRIGAAFFGTDNGTQAIHLDVRHQRLKVPGHNLAHRLFTSGGAVGLGEFLHQLRSGIELGILSHHNAGGLDEQHEREVERQGVFHHDDWLLGLIELCRSRLDINFARFRQGTCWSLHERRPARRQKAIRQESASGRLTHHGSKIHIRKRARSARSTWVERIRGARFLPERAASNSQAFVSAATCFHVSCDTV
jgi:hypothetical protein